MDTLIKVKELYKTYKMGKIEVKALDGINLDIKKGQISSLVGPSGSGKTSLLNQLGLIDSYDKNDNTEIKINEINIARGSQKDKTEFRKKHLGFIFQQYNLIPVFNVVENISLPLLLLKISEKEADLQVKQIIKDVGLEKFQKHKPYELSGGQQQRVSIARALVKNPILLLADEPTANLDSKNSQNILDLLIELNDKYKTTIVFSTHDNMVMKHSKRLIHLQDGQVIKDQNLERGD